MASLLATVKKYAKLEDEIPTMGITIIDAPIDFQSRLNHVNNRLEAIPAREDEAQNPI